VCAGWSVGLKVAWTHRLLRLGSLCASKLIVSDVLGRALYLLCNTYLHDFIYNKRDIRLLGYKQVYARSLNYKLYIKESVLKALHTCTFS
jgi:hypothetical protein